MYNIFMMKTLNYVNNNENYQVIVTYKHIRNIIYRYKNGVFYVSAPYLTSQKLILSNLDRFYSRLIKPSKQTPSPIQGNNIMILGESLPYSDNQIEGLFSYQNKDDYNNKLKAYALTIFTQEVRKYELLMGIKDSYQVKIRNMKTRYGSNSKRTNSITLQCGLIHYSLDIIDSVVVHELAHYFYFDHSENFYKIVFKYCPNYKECHKKLRKGVFK